MYAEEIRRGQEREHVAEEKAARRKRREELMNNVPVRKAYEDSLSPGPTACKYHIDCMT